jgi:hypothetical protein
MGIYICAPRTGGSRNRAGARARCDLHIGELRWGLDCLGWRELGCEDVEPERHSTDKPHECRRRGDVVQLGQYEERSGVHVPRNGALGIIQAGPDAVPGAPLFGDVQHL